jgi:integrase
MASLHRDPRGRSPYYYVAYRRGDGTRTFKSTKETDLRRATIVAQMMVRVAEEERRKDTTLDILNGIVQDTARRLGIQTQTEPTVRGYLEQWLANERGSLSEASYAKYSVTIRQFLECLGPGRACLKLSQITEQDIVRFRDQLVSEGRTPKTVNTTVRVLLKRPFSVAHQSNIISKNPVALVRPLRGKPATKAVFTLEQIESLLSVAKGDWHGLCLAGFFTAARLSDLAKLQWKSVDFDRGEHGVLTFVQSKTQRMVQIPLHPNLSTWLRTHRNDSAWVFPSLCNKITGGTNGLSQAFGRLLKEAGIEREEIRERSGEKGRTVNSLGFHQLRHTMNSILANEGVSQELRMSIVGHASKSMNSHYTHLEIASLQGAISKLPKVG